MFILDLLQLPLSSMESNATILRRRPRHVSFMDIRNSTRCHFSEKANPNITEMCDFVTNTLSCHYFLANIDYLKIIFCYFKIPLNGFVVFMGCLVIVMLYGLIYMLTKYFFLPNFEMLLDLVPISSYTFGYAGFGFFFFMPNYLETGLTCLFQNSYEATLRLSGFFGDLMRYFVLGICTLCVNGYKVRGLTLWSNILFLLMGYFYLIIVVHKKYEIFQRKNLINDDLYTLKFSAVSILFIFFLYMMANVLISYYKTKKERNQMQLDLKRMTPTNLVNESSEWKWWKIWWSSVNGYGTMKEPIVGVVTVLTPFYFLAANLIPVMDKKRHLHGWCKVVACISYIFLPFMCIPFHPWPALWLMLLLNCWGIALTILCATRARRVPNHLAFYAISGMFVCTLFNDYLLQEINNMIWQFVNWRYNPTPQMITQMYFNSGEIFSAIVLLISLIRSNKLDVAFGVIMSMSTYTIYLALPQLVLHVCYNRNTYLLITATSESCNTFSIVMIVCALFHISISGNEFRVSLLLYLLTLMIGYMIFQWMTFNSWVHPFGTLHNIQSPREPFTMWA